MTLIVASAVADTPDELIARAKAAAEVADLVEVRLDGPSGLPWDLRPFFDLAKPTLATMRHADDGGRSNADDDVRAEVLRRALLAGASWIDVEAGSSQARSLAKEAHDRGARVIVSVHDLVGTPDAITLVRLLRDAREVGADVAKIATLVRGPVDASALVDAAVRARAEGIPFALMAVNDPFLRLLAPSLGMALVYGSVPGAPVAAAGQVPAPDLRAAHASLRGEATGATRLAFIFGHPVAHSKSPRMQNAAFRAAGVDARYVALDVAPEGLADALGMLRASNAYGANITIPHKERVMPYLDEVDVFAHAAGAVNTVVVRDGKLVGYNTDGAGAMDALHEAGVAPKRALVLGAGGAARAVVASLRAEGVDVLVANRTHARAEALASELGAKTLPWSEAGAMLQRVDLLVNATSLGLHGETLDLPLPSKGLAVFDLITGETPLVRRARELGLRVVRGESMLLHQGARSFQLWTGRAPSIEAMRAALGVSS